jgi:hypothetical protein
MPEMSGSRPLANIAMFLDHLLGEPNGRELVSPSLLRWGLCICFSRDIRTSRVTYFGCTTWVCGGSQAKC